MGSRAEYAAWVSLEMAPAVYREHTDRFGKGGAGGGRMVEEEAGSCEEMLQGYKRDLGEGPATGMGGTG